MIRKTAAICAIVIFAALVPAAAKGQFTITVPKIPKVKKEKPAPPPEGTSASNEPNSTSGASTATASPTVEDDDSMWDNVNPVMWSERDHVNETLKAVETYTPETKTQVVAVDGFDWLLRAVSPSERAAYYKTWNNAMPPKNKQWFENHFDAIAKAATAKLPQYLMGNNAYTVRNPAEEKLMKAQLAEVPGMIVHKIGIASADWTIGKDSYNFPINRFKYGIVWGRNPQNDHPYCWFWYVNIIQDYAGGGTYGASYAKWVDSQLAGCPANGK